MAALFGIRALLTARLVMRTLIAQPGEPHRLLLEPTNGGNREKCILRAAITYFGVSPAHVFHVLARRKCAQQYSAQSAPPPAFFPCNLCPAYLWPDICLPAAIYGGRDNSNKGAATPADWHWCAPHLGQVPTSGTKQNFLKQQLTSAFLPRRQRAAVTLLQKMVKMGKGGAAPMYCSQAGTAAPLLDRRLFVK